MGEHRRIYAGDDVVAQLQDAFGVARSGSLRLVFDAKVRLDGPLLDVLHKLVDGSRLEELVLEHPSASIGFIASSLSLRATGTAIRAVRSSTSGALSAVRPSLPPVGAWRVAQVLGVDEEGVAEAIASVRKRGGGRCALVFPKGVPLTAEVAKLVADKVGARGWLTELAIVHPSPAAGFVASSIGLLLAGTRVRAASSLEDL